MASRFFPINVVGWPVNSSPKVESSVASLFYEGGKEEYLPARGLFVLFRVSSPEDSGMQGG